jgi:hypothetical protein
MMSEEGECSLPVSIGSDAAEAEPVWNDNAH